MRILIDIGHPAHVHLFKNFYFEMQKRGHEVTVTTKDFPVIIELLDYYRVPYINIGEKGKRLIQKGINQLKYNYKLLSIVNSKKIEIGTGSSITICHVSRLSGMKSILFDDDDDDVQPLMTKFGHPFAHCIISPDSLRRRASRTIYYAGYHELAYLHPSRFIPDKKVVEEAGIKEGEPYFVLRFSAFRAHHDIGMKGLDTEKKLSLVRLLTNYGKVMITSEAEIEPELEPYKMKIPPSKIHSLLYYAKLFVGDSQTMTSEAAILGTPAIRCNTFTGKISYLKELEENYGLVYSYTPENFGLLINKINELIANDELKEEWREKKERMLKEKINVTDFMIWFVENFPISYGKMFKNPDYQYNFR